jgi:hypothetical protein
MTTGWIRSISSMVATEVRTPPRGCSDTRRVACQAACLPLRAASVACILTGAARWVLVAGELEEHEGPPMMLSRRLSPS